MTNEQKGSLNAKIMGGLLLAGLATAGALFFTSGKKRKSLSGTEDDPEAERELKLYIDDDGDLYRQRKRPIEQNLARTIGAGKYDSAKAVKLWAYLIEAGAKKYEKEFMNPGEWNKVFPKKVRDNVAKAFAKEFEQEFNNNELGDDVYKLAKGKKIGLGDLNTAKTKAGRIRQRKAVFAKLTDEGKIYRKNRSGRRTKKATKK